MFAGKWRMQESAGSKDPRGRRAVCFAMRARILLPSSALERNVERRRGQFPVLNSVRDYLNRGFLRVAEGPFTSRPVGHDPGQFQRLGDPTTVVLAVELDRE